MARAGVRALEFWDPKAKRHGQAHMQARLGITNHLIINRIAKLEQIVDGETKLVNAYIRVDREEVLSRGQEVMGQLLKDLQVRRSIADGEGAKTFYGGLTDPLPGWGGELRDLVLKKKQARKIFVQVRP